MLVAAFWRGTLTTRPFGASKPGSYFQPDTDIPKILTEKFIIVITKYCHNTHHRNHPHNPHDDKGCYQNQGAHWAGAGRRCWSRRRGESLTIFYNFYIFYIFYSLSLVRFPNSLGSSQEGRGTWLVSHHFLQSLLPSLTSWSSIINHDSNLQGIVDVVLDDNSIRAVPRPGTSLR